MVLLIASERVPSCCGVVVEAEIQGCKGTAVVEPERMIGLDLEEMVVEPDESGRVSVVVANPSPEVVNLMSGCWEWPISVLRYLKEARQ